MAIIVVILDAFALVLVSALAEHVGQDQSAQTPPAPGAADQDLSQTPILIAAFLVLDTLVLIFFAALTEHLGEHQATQTPLARGPADQEAGEVMILVVAFLILDALALVFVASLTEHLGEHQAPKSALAHGAADQEAGEALVFAAAFIFVDAFILVVGFGATLVADETGDQQPPHALAASYLAAGEQAGDVVGVSAIAVISRVKRHRVLLVCLLVGRVERHAGRTARFASSPT
ncbi:MULTISPECIES: hypothetical protein [unclassified Phenylobacterium]|uniref:hypothetical protein n=1 Tax=unclassified Phenylobacterium TaxID=2640670 RepID=UPI0012E3DEFB|nr:MULTISPECIES: hypothetical protein [unclassified Phenylobacterium]